LCVTPLSLLGVLWPEAWHLAALALELLRWVLANMLGWGIPTWSVAAFPVWVAVAGVLGAGLLGLPAPVWWRCWGLPLLVPALGWQATPPPEGEVEMVVADVGQGQAVLVRTARHALLYDAGPRYSAELDAGQRVVVPLLQALDVRLDRLVLSHRDADHTGGAQSVLAMYPEADVLGSLPSRFALTHRPGYRDCEAGQSWLWDGVQFEVLHPTQTGPSRATSNAWSCVLRVRTATSSVLLAGDIEAREEAELVQRLGSTLQTDILLMPHHGSRTSSTAEWLDAVQPRVAWVQAGYRNRFGHPAPEVVARYAAHGITVLETARCGAIQWLSEQPQQMVCEREKRRRYWHHQPG
jgi:competence protein ComEC